MKPMQEWDKKEKLEYLENLMDSEDRFFNNYDKELSILCEDIDAEVRLKAIDALWDTPNVNNHRRLLDMAEKDPDVRVRTQAIIGLGRYMFELEDILCTDEEFQEEYADEDDIPKESLLKTKDYLLRLFNDTLKSVEERRHALEALGFLFDEEIEALIRKAYDSDDTLFKVSAIFAMGRNGNEKWQEIIKKELYNSDRDICIAALKTAGDIVLLEAGEDILKLTYSEDKAVAQEAVWALGKTGWEDGFDRLEELSKADDPQVRELAKAALEEWHMASGAYSEDDDESGWDEEDDWTDDDYEDEDEEWNEEDDYDDTDEDWDDDVYDDEDDEDDEDY
jgi:HEAT repeat protein